MFEKLPKIDKNKLLIPLASLVLAISAVTGLVGVANADTATPASAVSPDRMHGTRPAAMGKVTAVSGDTITLTDTKGTTSTTYTVDATNATITKRSAPTTAGTKPTSTTITVGQVAVGDMLVVQGTANGTNITATKIEDGVGGFGGRGGMRGPGGGGVMGAVTAISGNTITITGKDGKTYTVDASNSTLSKMESISVADVSIGDEIGVQGVVSGTTVTAKSIMDGMPKPDAAQTSTSGS